MSRGREAKIDEPFPSLAVTRWLVLSLPTVTAYRMPASWPSVAVAVAASLTAPTGALAQGSLSNVVLDYRVEEPARRCPSAAELRAAIVRQLGEDPFTSSPQSPSYDVHVKVTRNAQSLEARIEWIDEAGNLQGERRLSSEDDDCFELASGVAFAVAVQLQLRATSSPQPPPAQVEAEPEPQPLPKPKPRPRAPLPAERAPQRSVAVGVGGLARVGAQPGVAAGLHTFASLRGPKWALSVDAHATLPTTAQGTGRASFSAREAGVGLAPCYSYGVLDACALGSLSLVSIRGRGVDQARSPSAVDLGVGVRLQVAWPWRARLAAVVHVDVLAHVTRRDVLLNQERVWSTAPLGVAVGLDVAAIFR